MPTTLTLDELRDRAKNPALSLVRLARRAKSLGLKPAKRNGDATVYEIPDGFDFGLFGGPALPAVHKTPQMLDIEARYPNEDIRVIIKNLYERLGTQTAVAKELGLEQSVINIWAARLGIEFTSMPVAKVAGINGVDDSVVVKLTPKGESLATK